VGQTTEGAATGTPSTGGMASGGADASGFMAKGCNTVNLISEARSAMPNK
jgi:hypothetical protein